MDQRLRNGQYKQRAIEAARADGFHVLHAPIDDGYVQEETEWTPLTRRAAAASTTPVPVSRRTGLIAGGVVLASGGLGMIGVSAIALTAGLVIGAVLTAERMAPAPGEPVAALEARVEEGTPVVATAPRAEAPKVAAAPQEAPAALPAPVERTARAQRAPERAPRQATPRAPASAPVVAAAPHVPAAVPAAVPAPAEVYAPAPPAQVYAPAPPPPAEESWFATAARAATDLLSDEPVEAVDPLDALVADVSEGRAPAGDPLDALLSDVATERSAAPQPPVVAGHAAPPAGDPLADLLAEPTPAPMAPAPMAPPPVAPAPAAASGGWMASAASAVTAGWQAVSGDDAVAVASATMAPAQMAAAPSAPVAAPSAPVAGSWSAPSPAPVAAPAAAPAATWAAPAASTFSAPPSTFGAPSAPVADAYAPAPVAPAVPACYGEFCDDPNAMGYRDTANGTDLLADDEEDWSIDVSDRSAASQFADVGGESLDEPVADFAIDSMLVEIRTADAGVQVVIDGTPRGVTPLSLALGSGYHTVKLVSEDGEQSFQLRPQADPDTWCFAGKGRSFKLERCR